MKPRNSVNSFVRWQALGTPMLCAAAASLLLVMRIKLCRTRPKWQRTAATLTALAAMAAAIRKSAAIPHFSANSVEKAADASVSTPRATRTDSSEADRIWMLLKRYSVLSVRDRTNGSMHRLLQQLLRTMQNENNAGSSLAYCMSALSASWSFDPADTTTWPDAGKQLDHVKTIGQHLDQLLQGTNSDSRCPVSLAALGQAATLLTEAALYLSMALSRFDEANALLEIATRVQHARGPARSCGSEVQADMARILHTKGQVARYRGKLQEAGVNLDEALQMRRQLARRAETNLWDVAASLHELGVLRQKELLPEAAELLLRESLQMKRALRARGVIPPKARSQRFADESATLHQLAVTAMSAKPSRLDQAEELLQEALALETSDNPFGRGARAASLQQLARVEIRRGFLDSAQGHLQAALALHRDAYGKDTPHVNVVAVQRQLGKVAAENGMRAQTKGDHESAASFFGEAAGQLLEALRAQQRIYAASGKVAHRSTDEMAESCDHQEIAVTLGQLGMLERSRRSADAAQRYFKRQRCMITRLLVAEGCPDISGSGPWKPTAAAVPSRSEHLCRQLMSALQWERIVAKESGQLPFAKELSSLSQRVTSLLHHNFDEAKDAPATAKVSYSAALLEACVVARESVRKALVTAKKSGSQVPNEVFASVAGNLEAVLLHESVDSSSSDELVIAATSFGNALRQSTSDKFAACDALRAVLRELGVASNALRPSDFGAS
eukprot:TRINITY_DN51913_c0_g1_i1.p1 TRINITY_DN51913_c0_g1~~TRINITY_DN51913_c0_g1_i1.p1  ORF type:complete len:785 (+),score=160.23 TRINITY_DN51913_c0_g1_i1:165-2357(+)